MNKVAAVHTEYLLNYASLRGIEKEEIYANQYGLPDCSVQEGRIEAEQFLRLFQQVAKISREPFFGLLYGSSLNVRALGFVTHVQQHASTLGQAMFILKEYLDHSFDLVRLSDDIEEEQYIITLHSTMPNNFASRQLLDAIFGFIYRELTIILPDKELIRSLTVPTSNLQPYKMMINDKVEEGEYHAFIFNKALANSIISSKRPSDIALFLPEFLKLLDKDMPGYGSFSKKVRLMALSMCMPEVPNFNQVAAQFPLSHRSFQRKLSSEGISFRQISDDIRREIATFMSKDPKIMTKDIAYLLGYSEPSAYLHACKRWELHH